MRSRRPTRSSSSSRRFVGALAVAVLVLAACGDDDDDTSPDATTAAGTEGATVASGGEDTLGTGTEPAATTAPAETSAAGEDGGEVVVGARLEPTSLDIVSTAGAALDAVLLDNVYETLLTLDEDGSTINPGLAAVPEVSADGTVYTFTLQDGVSFHSGEPLTSADVVWSLDAQRAEGANESARLASIASVEAPDEQTVVVTLSQPDNDFTYLMTRRSGAVLQAEATGLENSANGTGPFTFVEWNVGSSITLARNDGYWGDAPAISGVTFSYFPDPNSHVNAFTTGDVDILTGIEPELVGPLQDDADYVVTEGTSNGEFTLGFNTKKEPLTDPTVRRAIRQAIDKDAYEELNNGFGTIIGGPVPPTDPWYEDLTDVAPYDPAAATAALEAAGLGAGFDVVLVWPNIYPTNRAEFVATQLSEVGINVEIQTVEFSVWLEQVFANHDYDMTAVLHVEPRDISNYANPDYYWQYDSPEVQQLINDAKTSADAAEATELLKEAARLISEESPVDWLNLAASITAARPEITGYPVDDTASRYDASGITVSG